MIGQLSLGLTDGAKAVYFDSVKMEILMNVSYKTHGLMPGMLLLNR